MFERFTDRARRVVVLAQEEARMLNHNYIGTEHILLGLIHEGEGVAAKSLESLGLSLEDMRAQVGKIIGEGELRPSGHIPFTPRAKKALELSLREALQLGHNYIGTEHILLGLIREGEGIGAQVLVKLGAELITVRQAVIQLLGGYQGKETAFGGGTPYPALLKSYDTLIAEARLDKESAIDAKNFDQAASARDREKQLVAKRAEYEKQWRLGELKDKPVEVAGKSDSLDNVLAISKILNAHQVNPTRKLVTDLINWKNGGDDY